MLTSHHPALPSVSTTDRSKSRSQVIGRARRSFIAAVLGLGLTAIAGCSKQDPATGGSGSAGGDGAGLEKVSLQLNWYPEAEHGGFYAALVHGYFKEAGLEVEIRSGGHNTPVAGEIITGRADFAVANAEDVVLYRNEGADAVVVMTAAQHHPRCLLMRTDSGVKSLRDLKGMTLEVIDGQPYLEFMRKEGLLEGVKLVPYFGSVAKTVADPKTGQQGYSFSEPLLARQQGAEISTFMISDLGFDPYSSVLATSGATIKKRPEVVRKMVAASIKGWQKYLSDPKETNAYILKQNEQGITQEALEYGVQILKPMCIPEDVGEAGVGRMTDERWATLVSQMTDLKMVSPEKVKAKDCYDLSFLPQPPEAGEKAPAEEKSANSQ